MACELDGIEAIIQFAYESLCIK